MSGVGYNGPDSPQYGEQTEQGLPDESNEPEFTALGDDGNPFSDGEEGLATEVPTAETMESGEPVNPSLPDPGQWDGAQEGEDADGYEQGQGGT